MLVLALLIFGCSCSEPTRAPRGKQKTGEALLVEWAALPETLILSDRKALAAALDDAATSRQKRAVGAGGDVLVVVLDTVRADHLGMYGYPEGTTPRLDRWAASARVWDNAWTDAPWTLPAHASMFTGKSQREHGARSVGRDDPRKGAPLADGQETVAERLQGAGWRTVGIAGNLAFLHPGYGLGQGFDVWMNDGLARDARGVPYLAADRVIALADEALKEKDSRPLFLFLNLMDAHRPYKARRGYVKRPERLRKTLPGTRGHQKVVKSLLKGGPLDPALRDSWIEAYDAELRFLDDHLGQFLERADRFEHIFILADHGEYLGEHGLVEHAKDVYEPVLHVPFLAKGAGFEPGHDQGPIQTHDLGAMVLQAAGLSTAGFERTESVQVADLYYTLKKDLMAPYGARFDRIRRAFRVGPHKLIVGDDGSREVYDLGADPTELFSLTELPAALRGVEKAWLAAHPEVPLAPVGSGVLGPDEALLKALGYAE